MVKFSVSDQFEPYGSDSHDKNIELNNTEISVIEPKTKVLVFFDFTLMLSVIVADCIINNELVYSKQKSILVF